VMTADHIHRAAPRDRAEPRARPLRQALVLPPLQRVRVRLLYTLLGQIQIAGDARGGREYEAPLLTVRLSHRVRDGRVHEGRWSGVGSGADRTDLNTPVRN